MVMSTRPSINARGCNVKWVGRRAARFGTRRVLPGWYKGPAALAEASGHRPWSESVNLDASAKSVALEEGDQA